MPTLTPPVPRECGTREEGGIYVGIPVGPMGTPVRDFIYDEPVPIPAGLDLPNRGMLLLQSPDGVYHLLDLMGEEFYPSPALAYEEWVRYGVSRRVQKNIDFGKLSPKSRLIIAHRKGYLANGPDLLAMRHMDYLRGQRALQQEGEDDGSEHDLTHWITCGKQVPHHPNVTSCYALWWHVLTGGPATDDDFLPLLFPAALSADVVKIQARTFHFFGYRAPQGFTPHYQTAFIASFPIVQFEVVGGAGSDESWEQVAPALAAGIPCYPVKA